MKELVENFPEMCEQALRLTVPKKNLKGVKGMLVLGMGGSGITGDIIRDCCDVRVDVCRDYKLPKCDPETLVIAISYSGNTEETLSSFTQALGLKNTLAITSGGKLIELARSGKIDTIQIPSGMPPRAALSYLLFPLIKFLRQSGVRIEGVDEAIESLKSIAKKTKRLREIGNGIEGQIGIYCPPGFEGAARRLKTQINENAKTLARWDSFPELNHNEHVGWENATGKNTVIILRDSGEHERTTARIEYMKEYIGGKSKIFEIFSLGKSKLSRELSLIYQGDLISIFLAEKNGVDATPVQSIDALKEHLSKIK
ncbi:MAG: bifunctional phosphoglucose/phosphomannose isomerase [Candidatus Aenigmarchaeota archaeon]|nr:bifunctional phosphoglucose/phosphomannose isomerase [Candidatus Aenigmarchaeota archaeon]